MFKYRFHDIMKIQHANMRQFASVGFGKSGSFSRNKIPSVRYISKIIEKKNNKLSNRIAVCTIRKKINLIFEKKINSK